VFRTLPDTAKLIHCGQRDFGETNCGKDAVLCLNSFEIKLIDLRNGSVWRRQKSVDLRTEIANTERGSLAASCTSLKMSLSIEGWYMRNHALLCLRTALKYSDTWCNK
jgi:hypothetical protein